MYLHGTCKTILEPTDPENSERYNLWNKRDEITVQVEIKRGIEVNGVGLYATNIQQQSTTRDGRWADHLRQKGFVTSPREKKYRFSLVFFGSQARNMKCCCFESVSYKNKVSTSEEFPTVSLCPQSLVTFYVAYHVSSNPRIYLNW